MSRSNVPAVRDLQHAWRPEHALVCSLRASLAGWSVDVSSAGPAGRDVLPLSLMGVGVLDAEHLPAAVMRDLTREVRQFETAFLAAADLPAPCPAADLHRGRGTGLRRSSGAGRCGRAAHPAAGPRCGRELGPGCRDRQRGRPSCWVPAAPRRPPRRGPLLVHQGRFTGRPSTIEVHPGRDGRLWVGEPVAPVAAGRFHAHLT
jgi:hypothetical protein